MRSYLLAAGALLACVPAMAAAQDSRDVALELRENGRVVASSNVRVQLGRPAALAISGPFTMRLRVDAVPEGYAVRPHVHAEGPAGWTRLPAPVLTVAAGEQARATLARPAGPPLEIAVQVD